MGHVSGYGERLRGMTDDELSAEWVSVMTARVEPANRQAQLASIEAVRDEINSRYEQANFSSLVITAEDALAVTEHLKKWIGVKKSDWFGPDQSEDA